MRFSTFAKVVAGLSSLVCAHGRAYARTETTGLSDSMDKLGLLNTPNQANGMDVVNMALAATENSNIDKVALVSVTSGDQSPDGLLDAVKNAMPGLSRNVLDDIKDALTGNKKPGQTTTVTVTEAAPIAAASTGNPKPAGAVNPAKAAASGTAAGTAAASVPTGSSEGTSNSTSLAGGDGGMTSGLNGNSTETSKAKSCGCSCLCDSRSQPNGGSMSSAKMVNGTGMLTPNGECACACLCPAGSFASMSDTKPDASGKLSPTGAASTGSPQAIQAPPPPPPSPVPAQEAPAPPPPPPPPAQAAPPPPPPAQAAPPPPPPAQAAPQPAQASPQPAQAAPQPAQAAPQPAQAAPLVPPPAATPSTPPAAQVAAPAPTPTPAGGSSLNLPLSPGAPAAAAAPQPEAQKEPQQNPDPINIATFSLSSSLVLGVAAQQTPTP